MRISESISISTSCSYLCHISPLQEPFKGNELVMNMCNSRNEQNKRNQKQQESYV